MALPKPRNTEAPAFILEIVAGLAKRFRRIPECPFITRRLCSRCFPPFLIRFILTVVTVSTMTFLIFKWSASLIATQLLVLVASWYIGSWLLSPLRKTPGPALAAWTRLWHVKHIVRGDQNVVLVDLHDKHGPFVRIAPDEVSIGHAEGIKKVLLAPLHKGYWYKALAIPDYRFQTPMSTTEPKKKNERSRNFASGYAMTNLLQNEEAVDSTIAMFKERLDDFAKSEKAFELDKLITFLAFDVVGEMLFSKTFGFLREGRDVGNAIQNGTVLSVYASVVGFVRWFHVLFLGNPFMTWLNVLPMGHLFDTTTKAIDDRLENRDSRFDSLAHWFRAVERNPQGVSMRDVYAIATGAVGAGSDTVSCGLQAFIYFMNRHPNAWDRVRAEMNETVGSGLCQDSIVSFADAQKLPFLQICIKEALRVFAPVPQGLPRVAPPGGITIGDAFFAEGTILSINVWVMHHNKNIWGQDAREFNPDRWYKDEISAQEKYFIPWGVGYNSCPGQHIAKIELSKVAATLVRDYKFRQEDPAQVWKWKACFTMVPHSWPCYVEKRN